MKKRIKIWVPFFFIFSLIECSELKTFTEKRKKWIGVPYGTFISVTEDVELDSVQKMHLEFSKSAREIYATKSNIKKKYSLVGFSKDQLKEFVLKDLELEIAQCYKDVFRQYLEVSDQETLDKLAIANAKEFIKREKNATSCLIM